MPFSSRNSNNIDSALHSAVDPVSWNAMTVTELKGELKSRNLAVSGVKAVLILRLEEYQQSPPPPPPVPSKRQSTTAPKSKYFANNDKKKKIVQSSTPLKGLKKSPPVTPDSMKTPTPTKRKSSSPAKSKSTSPRKRVKIEAGSLNPPQSWEKIYKLVEELRADKSAPVDTDGGEELPEKHLGPVVHRFQVLTALMLSSQTKDAVVGSTIKALQKHGLTVENIHKTDHQTLNALIWSVGFHNNKTRYMKQVAEIIITEYNGDIPPTAQEMMKLPGIGPKMAYIIESICFGTNSGIGVDTHMHRIFNALNWVKSKTPEQTREQLEGWLPKERWGEVNVLWVGFGQETQQQKEKALRKVLACSSPQEGLSLVQKVGLDVKKEAKRFGLEEEVKRVKK